MNSKFFLGLFAAVLCLNFVTEVIATAQEAVVVSPVLSLDYKGFWEVTLEGKWLISFITPTCGFCQSLQPKWEKLSQEALNLPETQKFRVASVDVAKEQFIGAHFNLTITPTIILVKGDEYYKYPDTLEREVDKILSFAKEGYKSETPSDLNRLHMTELTPDNIVDKLKDEVYFVEYYDPTCSACKRASPLWKQFAQQTKKQNHPWKVGRLDCLQYAEFCASIDVDFFPSFYFYKDRRQYRCKTPRTLEDWTRFASLSHPGSVERGTMHPNLLHKQPRQVENKAEIKQEKDEL